MENNKTQSAVEWLWDMLLKGEFINDPEELLYQAKEMEEQRIQQELEKLKDFDDWKEWKYNNKF